MASFSFRTGNAGKLLRLPLFVAGRLATLLIPRGRRWVFGCGAGIGDGALAVWRHAQAEGHEMVWLTGSAREEADAAALGIPTLPKHSVRGWWATTRAGVIVITHGFGDVNRYAISGAFVVQLWHGIPLKRLGLDSPVTVQSSFLSGFTPLRWLLSALYRGAAQRIRILPAASDRSRARLESAFGLGVHQVLVTGEPRVDVLSAGDAQTRRAAAITRRNAAVGPLPESARVVLYAPTWRDGAADPAVPSPAEWEAIREVLESQNAVLLIRSHPMGEGDYTPPADMPRVRMLGASVVTDVTPLLPAVDLLITDYSSLAYDVGLLAMPVIYFAPDAEDYARLRGFYGRYAEIAGPDFARDWATTLDQVRRTLADETAFTERAQESSTLSAEMHAFRDGENTARVYRAIRARGVPAAKGSA